MMMSERAVVGSEVFSLAIELADSGSFVSGDDVVHAVRSLALDTRLLGDRDAVALLDQRCQAALCRQAFDFPQRGEGSVGY